MHKTLLPNWLRKLCGADASAPKLFTAEQLAETFKHGYRAGQAAGPAEPVVHRSWADIIAEAEAERAERAAVLPLAGRR